MKDNATTKSTLLEHLINIMMERYPDCTDLHSELTGVHRVAKVIVSVCLSIYVYMYAHILSVCDFVCSLYIMVMTLVLMMGCTTHTLFTEHTFWPLASLHVTT